MQSVDVLVVGFSKDSGQKIANGLHSETKNVQVSPADYFNEAVAALLLKISNGINVPDAYVINGLIPRASGRAPESLGAELAERIYDHERTHDKTFMVDSQISRLLEAQRKGIHRLYYDGTQSQYPSINPIGSLIPDLRHFLKLD